jgi:hypothetical protein
MLRDKMRILRRFKLHEAFSVLILFGLTMGCVNQSQSERESSFNEFMPLQNANQELSLSIVRLEDFQDPNPYFILVSNNASNSISFPIDYGIRLFHYDGYEWHEILDRMKHISAKDFVVLHPKGQLLSQRDFSIAPDLPAQSQPLTIRVVVIGHMLSSDGSLGEEVSGYIDVEWRP